jgi:4a-hydroxytetrahydrobiopterin dehydratase
MKTPKLETAEIEAALATVRGWSVEGDTLKKTFTFPDFVKAIAFVDALAVKAEAANHHPDIDIRYNKVSLGLSTHDSGGITKLDFDLAKEADMLG